MIYQEIIKKIIMAGVVCSAAILLTVCSFYQSKKQPVNTVENQANDLQYMVKKREMPESITNTEAVVELSQKMISSMPIEYQIEDFPIVYQMPELPTGCEVTALTMVLNYYGYTIDKVTMATEYLPTVSANLHYGSDGLLYGSDLNKYFVGDPTTEFGYICGTGAIESAAESYLAEIGSELHTDDLTGTDPEQLYELVSEDIPVVVWVTIGMENRRASQGWYTEQGEYVDWSTNDHGAVLIGYSEDTVVIADPISGLMEYNRNQFETVFESRGKQSVILR